ncbi:hypothetical protein MASR2M48_21550 [Spirochaetota bacterium]
MKRFSVLFLLAMIVLTNGVSAQDERGVSFGIHILAGGRYDNVRMCAASPAGVPGGPIGELYFDVLIPVSERGTVAFNIPLFRPIMFALAFDMLQLEPLVMYEYMLGEEGAGMRPLIGGGLGMILHYGPDYNTSANEPGEPFFSVGPLFNGFFGLTLGESNLSAGIKGFYSPLFTRAKALAPLQGVAWSYTIPSRRVVERCNSDRRSA